MPTPDNVRKIPKQTLLNIIQRGKDFLKKNKVMQEVCNKYDFDIEDIDLIPVKFDDIDVSARTDKGVVTLNWKLLEDGDFFKDFGYLVHEFGHYIQQSTEPTQSADDGDYLANPSEQEAFQYQVKYIDEQFGNQEAKDYVDQVLDHHQETGAERDSKEKMLLEKVESLANLFLTKIADKTSDLIKKYPEFEEEIRFISNEDPSNSKKYLNYATNQLVSGQALPNEIIDVIKLFDKHHSKLKNKDINSWNFTELRDTLFQVRDIKSKREQRKDIKTSGAQLVHEDEQCKVLLVKDKAVACFYGSGTKWCITMSGESYHEDYMANNYVFFFILRKDLDESNPEYKIALAYLRNEKNKVLGLDYFDATDTQIESLPTSLVNASQILAVTKQIAAEQPKNILAQLIDNDIDLENINESHINSEESLLFLIKRRANIPDKFIIDLYNKYRGSLEDVLSEGGQIIATIAKYPLTPPHILYDMVENGNAALASHVVKNNNAGPDALQAIVDKKYTYLYPEVAKHHNTSQDTLKKILNPSDWVNATAFLSNPNLPLEMMFDIIKKNMGYEEVIRAALKNRRITREMVEYILSHGPSRLMEELAKERLHLIDITGK